MARFNLFALAAVVVLNSSFAGDAEAAQPHSWCNTLYNSTANVCNQTAHQPVTIPEDLQDLRAMCDRYWEILCAECGRYYGSSCGAERSGSQLTDSELEILDLTDSMSASNRSASVRGDLNELVELYDCQTGEYRGVQELDLYALENSCLAPACSKQTIHFPGGSIEYCDGTCSTGKSCQATLRNENDPSQGIERCSCKPTLLQ